MIIDSHTHILPPDISSNFQLYSEKDSTLKTLFPEEKKSKFSTAEELISSMNSNNINLAFVLGMGWTDPDLNHHVNNYILSAAKKYPDRIIPFTGINPSAGKVGYKEADRCIASGAAGFGEVHSYQQNFSISDKNAMSPFMKFSNEFFYYEKC